MWFVRWFLILVGLFYFILFSAFNFGQQVQLRFPWIDGMRETGRFELVVALFGAVLLGALIGMLVSFFRSLELRSRIRQLERRGRELKDELGRLRNLSVLDDNELGGESVAPKPARTAPRTYAPPLPDDDDEDLTASDLPSVRNSGL